VHLSILLLATDRAAAETLSSTLLRSGHGVTVVDRPEELVQHAGRYGLVIIDQVPSTTTVGALIADLRHDPATSVVPVLAVAQSDNLEARIALLEAGADDIITKPLDQVELEARVEALSQRFRRSQDGRVFAPAPIGSPQVRRTVAVYSPNGGMGTTTVATNLALIAAERHPGKVLIIDFDLSFGQVASHLNLRPRQTLLDLIRDDAALREPELFRTYAAPHAGGVDLLAAPPKPGFAGLFTGEHVELILARALEAYEVVVIDAGATLDERMPTILSRADVVIIPVLPEIPALNAVHLLLDHLTETGSVGATTLFVLNNAFERELLRRPDIESALGAKVTADLPFDPFVYLRAVNEGDPVVRSAPRTAPAERLRDLAAIVFATAAGATAEKPRKGLFGRHR
jgi:pilus assembly protein CpaE